MFIEILEALLFPGALFIICLGFVFDWLERKTVARLQSRIGPTTAGRYGFLQPVADFTKLLSKDEILPAYADRLVFRLAPALYFMAPVLGAVFIPITGPGSVISFKMDLFFIVFLFAFSAFVVAALAYASSSRYTSVSAGRLVLQYVGYENPMLIAVISAAVASRSLSITGIVAAQSSIWNVVVAPIAFIIFLICLMAELEKPPFDIPSAKQEIVAGWMTEFSGRALAFLKLSKEVGLVFGAALATSLFLGGPLGPIPAGFAYPAILYTIYFLVKLFAVGLLIMVLRSAFARLRIKEATEIFWLVLVPLSLVQMVLLLVIGGIGLG